MSEILSRRFYIWNRISKGILQRLLDYFKLFISGIMF